MKRQFAWLGFGIIVIVFFGTIDVALRTAQRQQINAPLIELSEDTVSRLNVGTTPKKALTGSIDINNSLDEFAVIYNKAGRPIAGTGYLNGKLLAVPIGVLTSSSNNEYSPVTLQPQGSLRFASITVSADKYYVLSGSSLRIADRSSTITDQIVALGCAVSLAILAVIYWVIRKQ